MLKSCRDLCDFTFGIVMYRKSHTLIPSHSLGADFDRLIPGFRTRELHMRLRLKKRGQSQSQRPSDVVL